MPDELLPWNEENLCKVLTDLNEAAIHDKALHQQLMTDPYTLLAQRIQIPPYYQKNIYAKPKDKPGLLISVPIYQGDDADGSLDQRAPSAKDTSAAFAIQCTVPIW